MISFVHLPDFVQSRNYVIDKIKLNWMRVLDEELEVRIVIGGDDL